MPGPVFVAGTGRSGTSRIADIIGEHPLIHRIPIETRFIPDPGGLRDAADALSVRRYIEVRAEGLAADWPAERATLFEQLGVDDHATPSTFDPRLLDRRHPAVDGLDDIITAMGYE
ncbi:sulfotransferase [Actinoplanes bogorensis]|uniref:Sulfotransferase n=1 Tax=Paractinoplanes bogorensis TaxID=1610840 RepID=A0ABS5YQ35_9ACTN|nr:sulfotransferase [Actinoplanes bogorensis]MBU2665562.1 sulfotransferase [Actinoplanes bogorensis]